MGLKSAIMLLTLTVIMGFVPSQPAFAEDDTMVMESFMTETGSLANIDTDHNRVTLHWMNDDVRMTYQDTVLDVPESCAIIKNGETIELDDLESGDAATVRYDSNAQPLPKASSIIVTE